MEKEKWKLPRVAEKVSPLYSGRGASRGAAYPSRDFFVKISGMHEQPGGQSCSRLSNMFLVGPSHRIDRYTADSTVRQEAGEDAEQGLCLQGNAMAVSYQYTARVLEPCLWLRFCRFRQQHG